MDEALGDFEKSRRFKRVDYREVLPSGNKRFKNNEVSATKTSSDRNSTSDSDWVQDARNETKVKSNKTTKKKNESDKKTVGKTKSSSSSSKSKANAVVKDSSSEDNDSDNDDEDDDDDSEIESVDEGENFAELVKQFKERGAASKIRGSKGVPLEEINDAKQTALQELARFKRSLEPFLTEKGDYMLICLYLCMCTYIQPVYQYNNTYHGRTYNMTHSINYSILC